MTGVIFTYLLTAFGSVIALYRPFVGVLVYVSFAIIKPESLWPWAVPAGNYSRIVGIALLIGWVVRGIGTWTFGRGRVILAALAAMWLWGLLLAFSAPDQPPAWRFVEGHAKILLPMLVAATMIKSVGQLKQLAWVIVLSQGYVAFELNLSYLKGFNQLHEVGFATMDNNTFTITLVTCIGVAIFLGLHAERLWQKAVAVAATVLMIHAVMFSFSRGGLLALIITGGAAFLLIRKRAAHYLFFAALLVISGSLAGKEVMARFYTTFASSEERDGSSALRIQHWEACARSMLKEPLGLGPNQWHTAAPAYGLPAM